MNIGLSFTRRTEKSPPKCQKNKPVIAGLKEYSFEKYSFFTEIEFDEKCYKRGVDFPRGKEEFSKSLFLFWDKIKWNKG